MVMVRWIVLVAAAGCENSGMGEHDLAGLNQLGVAEGAEEILLEASGDFDAPPRIESVESSAYELCFSDVSGNTNEPGPDYDQFVPVIGSHCSGTNHQDIQGVERVVFLGDSITVGTPPTSASSWYRNQVAGHLANRFNLDKPSWFWENVDLFEGTSYDQESGDFASCARWGARADDLNQDSSQLEDCFSVSERQKTTLVIMTIGGNDLNSLQEGFQEGKSHSELWMQTEETMTLYREAIEWLTDDPNTFPNGVYVVSANLYEYTDGTGDVASCPAASLAGYQNISDPELTEMVVWSMEEYMSVAVDTQTDLLFLLESFCGHGYRRNDPNSRCYRGPNTPLWFDSTCIHPNDTGHTEIAKMVMNVVDE